MKEQKIKFDKAENLVREAILEHRCLLKNDYKLCKYIYKKLGYGEPDFSYAFENAPKLGLPTFKTIMRVRLDVQKEFKEEAKEMDKARMNLTKEYIDYGLGNTLGEW